MKGDDAAAWFSEYLGLEVRLVKAPTEMQRFVGEKYRAEGASNIAGFGDGFPFLMISEASLAELARMVGEVQHPIIMRRFRPNIVIKGANAFEEDGSVAPL